MKRWLFFFSLFIIGVGYAQTIDVEAVAKAKPLSITGGANFSANTYSVKGIEARRAPNYYLLSANLNLNFFNVVNAPLSVQFSPQGSQFNYPYLQNQNFNQMGISPKYKWLTLHGGYRSLSLSQFSLGGNRFYGLGIEVKSNDFPVQFVGMYGRLAKAIENPTAASYAGSTLYNRLAYGGKVIYKKKKTELGILLFKAWDVKSSLVLRDTISIQSPKENLILGVTLKQQLSKLFHVKFDFTSSAYTNNVNDDSNELKKGLYGRDLGLFTPRFSTRYSKAIVSSIAFTPRIMQMNISYRRIDPDYASLGIPFISNDMEDITIGSSWSMLKGKVNMNLNGGLQRNNIEQKLSSSMKRWIGSASTSVLFTKKLNASFNYSNYTTNTSLSRIQQLDSLMYFQVTQNVQASLFYNWGDEKVKHNISSMGSYQIAKDIQNSNSELYMANLRYGQQIKDLGFAFSGGLGLNINSFVGKENTGIGPQLSVSKTLWKKKIQSQLTYNHLSLYQSGQVNGKNTSIQGQLSYSKDKHSLSLNGSKISNNGVPNRDDFTEWQISFQYGYRF